MRVITRGADGKWDVWSVGIRRIVWDPKGGPDGSFLGMADGGEIGLFLMLPFLAYYLIVGLLVLLVSLLYWPTQYVTGRWTVVARGPGKPITRKIQGRQAANALAARWAKEIETHGAPLPDSSDVASDRPSA